MSRATERGVSRATTILLVDDNEALREAFARLLEREGYHVLRAGTPREASNTLRERDPHPDLVISDMILPEPQGREFLERLVGMSGTTPVLFISGYPRDEAERRAGISAGPHFLPKPFGVHELHAAVRALLERPAA